LLFVIELHNNLNSLLISSGSNNHDDNNVITISCSS